MHFASIGGNSKRSGGPGFHRLPRLTRGTPWSQVRTFVAGDQPACQPCPLLYAATHEKDSEVNSIDGASSASQRTDSGPGRSSEL